MNLNELAEVLEKHQKWLRGDFGGVRANLDGANLTRANLTRANLDGANLDGANLYGANLTRANLDGANLDGANLDGANLTRANLYGANLTRANLYGANLTRANLDGALNLHIFQIAPSEGSFVAWKKLQDGMIAKLEIPSKAARINSVGSRKCRAPFVKVIEIRDAEGKKVKQGIGKHDGKTIYRVGKITKADSFNDDVRVECANGIHFFMTRQEAAVW